ncbi:polysaccharide deacetylase family protein [Clostridium sp. D2Q-11]|uniref:Polysaccharide deacetylase family protein n=1 Tax=Anaeromonas frigoriresistens TaxID=2683708 RepID=A0A942UYB6_9FIRM|nr:polysaccharide deacetylase family protein [Anaeromonas frigoriresistens]MBS4539231.1 polysaccharide deacetylase family protein [Anaeromonas frigoriresistens]
MKRFLSILVLILTIISVSGCNQSKEADKSLDSNEVVEEESKRDKLDEEKNDEEIEEIADPKEQIDLSLKPNENGEVMVLMYHGITETEDVWDRTYDNFKKDLKVLYEKGYRPISLEDFVNNNITTEAGYTPIVLTFDDGRQNNFNIIEENGDKIVDPNSAVGILEEFHKDHTNFPLEATFFINGTNPFRQPELIEYKLNYIIDKGMDIGNHTINHNDMSDKKNQDPEKIQEYIGKEVEFINSIISEYNVNTYALCNGGRPDEKYEKYLEEGTYEGTSYKNIAILNVGWKPNVSPISSDFNPLSIQRVRASETQVDGVGMYDWIESFDKNPSRRFISDGNKDIVTIPKNEEEKIDKDKLDNKELYIYESN